jgi:hypothetical protein
VVFGVSDKVLRLVFESGPNFSPLYINLKIAPAILNLMFFPQPKAL